ncbi:MAG: bifunctional folylpolyglutamate synthase/dihydrofolate synthase, partial [Bacteroidota bacterium]
SHMLASILQEHGYKTGLYTSPHLLDFRERIRVNGEMILREEVVDFVNEHFRFFAKIHPSFFEATVAMAFAYFSKREVDIAVVETGMGGRLDSTNIIMPILSVITNIGMDHTEFLGDTLAEIAKEKAGIIKKNIPVVIGETSGETSRVFSEVAREKNAPLYFAGVDYHVDYSMLTLSGNQSFHVKKNGELVYKNLEIDLLGMYQGKNLLTVLKSLDVLSMKNYPINERCMRAGLSRVTKNTGLAGRWQIMGFNPMIVCDTGHNEEGIREVLDQVKHTPYKQLHVVLGFVKEKDHKKILSLFPRESLYYATKANIPRSLDEKELEKMMREMGFKVNSFSTVIEALVAAKKNASEQDLIFIGGSTFVVAEVI